MSLLATRIEGANPAPTALLVGYTITAAGFLLFFGPWSVAVNIAASFDRTNTRVVRALRGLSGAALFAALSYIILCIAMLMAGTDIVCTGTG